MTAYRSNTLFQVFLELSKVRITVAVAFTTIAGYVLSKKTIDAGVIMPVAGIFFMACGASVINHLQERKSDRKMERTKNRPLPSGKVTVLMAVILAAAEVIAGSVLLLTGPGLVSFLLALFALIWYNAVYTNLKRYTVHAVIPGSLIGSVPPLVGWVSAGGSLLDPHAWIIAFFFFIWQVPHFYLLAMKYSKDYYLAGFPALSDKYSPYQSRRIVFYWVAATAICSMFIPMFGVTGSILTLLGIGVLSMRLIYLFIKPVMHPGWEYNPGKYFMRINYYVLSVVLLTVIDATLTRIF